MQVFIIASIFNLQYNFNCPYYYIQLTQIINRLCQEYWIAKMKSADKTDHLNRLEAFIIWENHKQNNANKPLWWLINPTKKEFTNLTTCVGIIENSKLNLYLTEEKNTSMTWSSTPINKTPSSSTTMNSSFPLQKIFWKMLTLLLDYILTLIFMI